MTRTVLVAVATAFAVLFAGTAYAAPTDTMPPPGPLDVALTLHGTGCRYTDTRAYMRPDNSELLVNFDEFVAQAGPGTRPTDWRKNCNLEAQVDVPAGYTFTITGASYFGYADLSGGATAMFGSRYYFGAGPGPDFDRRPVTGSPWVQTDTAVATPASCDGVRQLTLDTELRVTKGTSRFPVWVQLSHDDKRFSAAYTLRWQRCRSDRGGSAPRDHRRFGRTSPVIRSAS